MAKQAESKLDAKVILMIVAVVALVGLAIWQATKATGNAGADAAFETKIQAPPDNTRPPGFEKPGGDSTVNEKQ